MSVAPTHCRCLWRENVTHDDSSDSTVSIKCFVVTRISHFLLGRECMNRCISMLKATAIGLALLGLIAASSSGAFGQAISGALVGTVVDSSGAAVAGASVNATNLGTGTQVTTATNGTGGYHLENLPVGTYRITVTASGFRPLCSRLMLS